MNTYKITNISHLLGKRDHKYNSTLDIDYIDNMVKKVSQLRPEESLYLTVNTLPLSLHRLRIKNLIDVVEVSPDELKSILQVTAPKPEPEVVNAPMVEKDAKKKNTRRKK